jgi:hypothetical protein
MTTIEELVSVLDQAAKKSSFRTILVVVGGTAHTIQAQGEPGASLLSTDSPDIFEELGSPQVSDDAGLHSLAHAAVEFGVQSRVKGDLLSAVCFQRLAVWLALRLGDARGVQITVDNLWIARRSIADAMVRGISPPSGPGGNNDFEMATRAADQLLRRDAPCLADAMERYLSAASDIPPATWLAAHRLAQITGRSGIRSRAQEALSQSGSQDASYAALTAALDVIGDFTLESVLSSAGITQLSDKVEDAQALVPYRRLCPLMFGSASPVRDECLVQALQGAFEQLSFLRLKATTGGGAFGHHLSYGVAPLMNEIGRALVSVRVARGEVEFGLRTIEAVLARSMGDWMARTHGLWSYSRRFSSPFHPLTGSVNGSEPADITDIVWVASKTGPILILAELPDRYGAWLIRRDGRGLQTDLGDLRSLLKECAEAFPHVEREGQVRHIGAGTMPSVQPEGRHELLRRLEEALFTPTIRDALADQGDRLVIVADSSFNTVPFAALRDARGDYLIERTEVEIWPSVTTRLAIHSGATVPTWQRAKLRNSVEPLVLGVGSFDTARVDGLQMDDLPGAITEAKMVSELLAVKPRLDAEATRGCLIEEGQGAEILHLSTHCLLDEETPEQSFVVLEDGTLTANELYAFDRGLRVGLVVMSACQTALGGFHPDSIIGLTNAMLIAGAQCVLSTTWKIPDLESASFMKVFYKALDDTTSVATALRKAQISMLRSAITADPFYWAAFRATGAASPFEGEIHFACGRRRSADH